MPLLASGHPRSIEWVNKTKEDRILDDDSKWHRTIQSLISGANAATLIQSLTNDSNNLQDFSYYGKLTDIEMCFDAVLSWDRLFSANDSVARSLIEENGLFLIPYSSREGNL